MPPVRQREVSPKVAPGTYVSILTADELAQRGRDLIDLLNAWETEGDEREQRETLTVLREALGTRRVASSRVQFL